MGDLTRIDASVAVEITDGISQSATVTTTTPGGSDGGLVVRNIPSGTQTIAGTITNVPSGTQTIAGTVTLNSNTVTLSSQTVTLSSQTVTAVQSGTYAVNGTVTNVPSGTQTIAGTVATNADANVAPGTAPSKVLIGGLVYNTAAPSPTNGQSLAFQADSAGNLKVAGTLTNVPSGTQPISGTVTNVPSGTQTIAGTVTNVPSGTQTIAGTVTNVPSGTQAVSGTVTLNSNTVTLSSQTVTAVQSGTYAVSGTVTNVPSGTQTIAGTVTNVPSGTQTIAGTVATNADANVAPGTAPSKVLIGGLVYNTAAPAPTNGQSLAFQADSAGNLKVAGTLTNVPSGTQPVSGTVTNVPSGTQPVSGTVTNVPSGTQPVSGTVTLNSNTVTLSSQTVTAVQSGTYAVSGTVTNVPSGTQTIAGTVATNADQSVGAGTVASKSLLTGLVYNTAAPAPTNGQGFAAQGDLAGNLKVMPGLASFAGTAWNSSTALNATQLLAQNTGASELSVLLVQTSTLTAGAVTFEGSYDGTNWITVPAAQVIDPSSLAQISIPYTVQANTNKAFLLLFSGFQQLRAKLSTQITGSGSVTPTTNQLAYQPLLSLNSAGVLKTDGSSATQPVSGTVTNVPSGTQTIAGTVTNVPSGTQTIAGTVTLSSNTVTLSSQTVTAVQSGTYAVSGTVTNVPSGTQTIAGTVATNADAAIGAGTAPSKALIGGLVYNTAAPVPTNGQTVALQGDSSANLKVNIAAGTVTVAGTVTNVPSGTQTVAGTVTNVPSGTQTVAGTVTAIASGTQAVSGTITNVPSGTQTVALTQVAGTINNNQKSTTTTATQLTTASTAATFGVIIRSLSANTNKVYVGASGVTTSTGYELAAGENISMPINNANLAYIIALSGTQTVCWVAI